MPFSKTNPKGVPLGKKNDKRARCPFSYIFTPTFEEDAKFFTEKAVFFLSLWERVGCGRLFTDVSRL
jgi:hypothetical protein